MTEPQACARCSHPSIVHSVILLYPEAGRGGIVVCSRTCPCIDVWAAEGYPRPELGNLDCVRDQFWAHARDNSISTFMV